jgi:hypothetical protein
MNGLFPPNMDEVVFMLDGAKVLPGGMPPLSLPSWCSGTVETAGRKVSLSVFLGFAGGVLQVQGGSDVWFEAGAHYNDLLANYEHPGDHFCVSGELPRMDSIASASCVKLDPRTTTPLDSSQFVKVFSHVVRADRARFGELEVPGAYRDVTTKENKHLSIDFTTSWKGWIRHPEMRRLCFVPAAGATPAVH